MLFLLALLALAHADTPSEGLTVSRSSSVCDADIVQFCASEKDDSKCAQFKCLSTHITELSGPCALYVQEKQLQKESCKNDTATLCEKEESRWGKRKCLIANLDKLNPTCAAYIKDLMKEYEVSPTACDNDATTLCSSVSGFSQTVACMKQNFEKLSKECRRFFWKLKRNSTRDGSDREGSHEESGDYHHEGYGRRRGGPRGPRVGEGYHHEESGDRSDEHSEKRSERGEKGEKGSYWKKGKKGGCTRKLKEACDTDLTAHCANIEGLRDMKECLILKWSSLNKNCSEFILNPFGFKDKTSDVDVTDPVIDVDPVTIDVVDNQFEIENVEESEEGN